MRGRSLGESYRFKRYRVCPDCQAKYVPDAKSRRRAWLIVCPALITVALAAASWRYGFPWGLLSMLSGIASLGYAGYAAANVRFVPFED